MAYTIISQNNNTTTLSDGVNTITVPSRVNLTSGNFTIVEVNNNMATLEDGDGNVYRDIPCVATLAGEGGGGSALPDQTGNSGKFLTTDGTDASWETIVAQTSNDSNRYVIMGQPSQYTGNLGAIRIGYKGTGGAGTLGQYSISIGDGAYSSSQAGISIGDHSEGGYFSIALGARALATGSNCAQINLSGLNKTNSDANTVKIANANGNFEIMSADGTIPTARLTKVNSTITLTAAGWSSNTQTVTVTGMTATGVVLVSPDPTDQSAYTSAGIICTAQAADSLTFTATTTPSADIDVNVVML